ncbi:hypothetical protein Emag_004888 [Eimeria magna]
MNTGCCLTKGPLGPPKGALKKSLLNLGRPLQWSRGLTIARQHRTPSLVGSTTSSPVLCRGGALIRSIGQGRGASSTAEAVCRTRAPARCCRDPRGSSDEWRGPLSQVARNGRFAQLQCSPQKSLRFAADGAEQDGGTPLVVSGSGVEGLPSKPETPAVLLPALVAAAEEAAAQGCGCCPIYWQGVASAAATADFTLSWGISGPLQGPAKGLVGGVCLSHVALPLLRPLLRLVVRLSAATEAAADDLLPLLGPPGTREATAAAAAWVEEEKRISLSEYKESTEDVGDGAQAFPQESAEALVRLLLLCRATLGALIEALRCALRGLSRHTGGSQGGPLLGTPLSVRELSCVAGSFRGPRKALSLLYRLKGAGAPSSLQSQWPSLGAAGSPLSQRWTERASFSKIPSTLRAGFRGSLSGAHMCEPPASIALWGQELLVMYQEAIGGTLLLSLGAPQRARLPEGALTGSLWGPLNSASWKGSLRAPTGRAGAQGLILKNSLTLSGMLQLIAAFEAPLVGFKRTASRAGSPSGQGPPLGVPIPSLKPPYALLQLLERQIWEAQGYWGPPMEAVRRPRKGSCLSAAAKEQQRQKQQQQQDQAESVEVEKLIFAASALAEARAAEGPIKGQRGPFFLGLSLIGDALLHRLEALLSSVPTAFKGSPSAASIEKPPGGPPAFVPDPLMALTLPLLGEGLLEGLLPSSALGAPGSPWPAAVAVLPLLLLQSLVRAEISHEALLAGICFGLVRPLRKGALVEGHPFKEGAFEVIPKTHQVPHAFGEAPAHTEQGTPKEARQGLWALSEQPPISCVLDLWPSAAICQLTEALSSLGFSSPAFFRFLFAHYEPPRKTPKGAPPSRSSLLRRRRALRACWSRPSGKRSSIAESQAAAATAAAAAEAARRALGGIAAACGARDPADLEEEGPRSSGGALAVWEASLGWLLRCPKRQRRFVRLLLQRECEEGPGSHWRASPRYERDFSSCSKRQLLQMLLAAATSGAPPPRPQWLRHFCMILKTPEKEASCAAGLDAAAESAGAADTKDVETAALLLPYLPPLSAMPMVGFTEKGCTTGPSAHHASGGLKNSHEAASMSGFLPLAEKLRRELMGRVDPCALPSLLLGLLLHAPPPKHFSKQKQPCVFRDNTQHNSSSCSVRSTSSWPVLGALCLVLEGTARALLSVWERDLPTESLGGPSIAAIFGLPSINSYSTSSSQGAPPGKGLTGAAAARLCRQSFTACLALAHLVKPLPVTPQLSPAASSLEQQQQRQPEIRGRRVRLLQRSRRSPGVSVPPEWALRLLPLRHLRQLLLVMLLSSSPSLWHGASHAFTKAQEPESPLVLLRSQGSLATTKGAVPPEAKAAAEQRFQQLLDCLLQQQQHQQQQHFIRCEPTSSHFQREVAATLLGLSDSLGALPTSGAPPDKRAFLRAPWRVEKEFAVGPYFIDLLVEGAPANTKVSVCQGGRKRNYGSLHKNMPLANGLSNIRALGAQRGPPKGHWPPGGLGASLSEGSPLSTPRKPSDGHGLCLSSPTLWASRMFEALVEACIQAEDGEPSEEAPKRNVGTPIRRPPGGKKGPYCMGPPQAEKWGDRIVRPNQAERDVAMT